MSIQVKLGDIVTYIEQYNGAQLKRKGKVINVNYNGRIIVNVKEFSCAMDCNPSDIITNHSI